MASAGPYASLHLAPDRQPRQQPTVFLQAGCPSCCPTNSVKAPKGCVWLTHTRLTALFPGLPRWATTRKVKPIWILLKQVAVASAGPYASLHLAPDRQPQQHSTTLFFTGRMPFLPPNQQCQSTEGLCVWVMCVTKLILNELVDSISVCAT